MKQSQGWEVEERGRLCFIQYGGGLTIKQETEEKVTNNRVHWRWKSNLLDKAYESEKKPPEKS